MSKPFLRGCVQYFTTAMVRTAPLRSGSKLLNLQISSNKLNDDLQMSRPQPSHTSADIVFPASNTGKRMKSVIYIDTCFIFFTFFTLLFYIFLEISWEPDPTVSCVRSLWLWNIAASLGFYKPNWIGGKHSVRIRIILGKY